MLVIDPCYREPHLGVTLDVVPGVWTATVLYLEAYVRMLICRKHYSHVRGAWLPRGRISVDAGQVCMRDADRLVTPEQLLNQFRPLLNGPIRGGITAIAAVSKSGCGDGEYPVEVKLNPAGRICAVRVVYLRAEGDK
jgi:hypothetical protein